MKAAAKKASKGKSKPVATKSKPKTKAKPAKPAAKKAPAKKAPAKAPAKKATPKKAPAKSPPPKKAPAKPAAKAVVAKPAAKAAPPKPAAKAVVAKPAAKAAPPKVAMLTPAKLMPAKLAPAQSAPAKKPARSAPPRADFGAPVEGFFAAQPPELRSILDALRELIQEAAPEAHASLKWGQPFYTLNSAMMCALGAHKAHVNLILVGGPDAFDDPDHQLLGAGTGSRHLRVTSLAELPRARVRQWLAVSARYASNRGGYTGPRSR